LRPIRQKGLAKIGEIKRMYAREAGRGVGSSLLQALEERGRAFGYQTLWLETRRINKGAVKFYLKHGYKVRENYGPYIGRAVAVCFEKNL
jgi:ribosomal protein S18 acetylase RimI-like enzyme